VLSARIPDHLYETIRQLAEASGRSISEEVVWRVQLQLAWEKQKLSVEAIQKVKASTLRQTMEAEGYTPVRDVAGTVWLEPGMASTTLRTQLAPELKEAISEAVREAVREALKGYPE